MGVMEMSGVLGVATEMLGAPRGHGANKAQALLDPARPLCIRWNRQTL